MIRSIEVTFKIVQGKLVIEQKTARTVMDKAPTFTKGLIFDAFRLSIESITPMGLDPSEASFLSSTASNSGESSSNWSFSSTTFESANDPSLSLSCFSRKAGAKKVSLSYTNTLLLGLPLKRALGGRIRNKALNGSRSDYKKQASTALR